MTTANPARSAPAFVLSGQQVLDTPKLLREPYRLLFPLGLLLAWAGVFHWLLLGMGLLTSYRSVFHAMAQIQGTLTCFALGFLMTFVPRRTGTPAASATELALACLGPVVTTLAAWLEHWVIAQLAWWVAMGTLAQFVVRRSRAVRGGRTLHASFVWVPLSLVAAVAGSALTGVGAALGAEHLWLHDVGKDMLLQGLFTGLALGVGGLLLPVLTRGGDAAAGQPPRVRRGAPAAHAVAALAYFGSFFLDARVGVALGSGFRAGVVVLVLVGGANLWRPPTERGLSRWIVWASAWAIPTGYALVALMPPYRTALLHLTFIGGFGLLTFTIASHVTLVHGGRPELTRRSPWQLALMLSLFLLSVGARLMVSLEPLSFRLWLSISAGAFLLATLAWATLTFPALVRPLRSREQA